MSTSLAIVEKKPPFAGGGCASGMLFHLLDWHRRLARKRRLFSPRRLLPWSVRGGYSPRRLLPPPSPAPPPRPAPHGATRADGSAAPGVVARLMGLESWPATAAQTRPQKQRKVDAASPGGNESAVVVVLPPSQRPPAPEPAQRSHHSADLSARSPRRSRLVHAAAAKLLEPGARANSRASARLALAYACSSPQHRKEAIAGGHMLDDFLSRSDSLSLERSTPLAPPAHTDRDIVRCHKQHSAINTMSSTAAAAGVVSSSHTAAVVPRIHFDDADTSRGSSDVDATRRHHRARTDGVSSCERIRSNSAGHGARTGEERLLRKRGTFSRPDVSRSVGSGNSVSSTRPIGGADRVLVPGNSSRRAAHKCSGPRRESVGSITPQRSIRRDTIDPSGLTSTSRNTKNVSEPRRRSRKKVDRLTAASGREDCNGITFASSSSVRPVLRASSHSKISEKRGFQSTRSNNTACARIPVVDARCSEAEPAVVATSEKEEFSRLLKAKINELGISHRVEPSDAHSGTLTASVLQELISALTSATNTSASESGIYSDSSAPLNYTGTVYNSNDQSPVFQRRYQGDHEADSSATCTNNEANQPSPTSVLEACFSNDTSSLGSPTEKIEGKQFFVSIDNKMEDLFNLEPDIVDLAISIDTTTKADAPGSGAIPCLQDFAARDFKVLESRLHSIGEAISNAELLLCSSLLCNTPSSPPLHSFIIEMLETIEGICGRSDSFGLTEENKYQRTNFLFDCIVESLNSKFCNFGKCGYKVWLGLPLTLNKDVLKTEICEEISSWREASEFSSKRVAEKELDELTAMWDSCQVEAFDISIAIENDILAALVDEFAFAQW